MWITSTKSREGVPIKLFAIYLPVIGKSRLNMTLPMHLQITYHIILHLDFSTDAFAIAVRKKAENQVINFLSNNAKVYNRPFSIYFWRLIQWLTFDKP